MSTESDTPETDEILKYLETHPDSDGVVYSYCELAKYARRLERERNAALSGWEDALQVVERSQRLREGILRLKQAKGRHHAQIACEALFKLLES